MVRTIKSKKHNSLSLMAPLLGVLTVLVVGFTFMMANSKESQDVRSSAAPRATVDATISLFETDPKLGDWVHFNYTLPKGIKEVTGNGTQARIQTMCYQNGTLVYGAAENAVDVKVGAQGELLGGGSSQWLTNGGPAECISTLYQWTYKGTQQFNQFATTSFTAGGK